MTACDARVNRADIDRHFSGRISARDERRLREHLGSCEACQRYYERHLILAKMDSPRGLSAQTRLGIGLALVAPTSAARLPLVAGLGVLAAAAAIAVTAPALLSRHAEFTARGSVEAGAAAELVVYRATRGARPEPLVGSRIGKDDELAFTYTNRAGYPYLLVFGVDEHGHVYWYQPGWVNPEDAPHAVAVQPGPAGHELPEATRHAFDGDRLRLIAVFARTPLSTRDVEARLARGGDLRAAFPDAFTVERDLAVGP